MPNPGQLGPSPAPAAPVQPISSSPLVKELFGAPNMQTIGIAAVIGTAAALVLSIFPAIAMNSMSTAAPSLGADSTLNQAIGSMFITGNGMNFFHYLFLSLVMGLSGGIHFDIVDLSSSSMDASNMMSYPLGLTGLALLIGTAFGAFMLARSKSIRFKFTGLISGFITGLLPAVVITLLAAIAAAPLASGTAIVAKVTGATVRTFFMAYLLSALGALAGYALAQYAPDSKNVFGATWQWAHRVRGYTRTVVSVLSFQLALLFIVGLVALSAVSFSSGQGILILTFPVTLLMIGEFFFTWGTFGAITLTESGQLPQDLSLFSINLSFTVWPIWILFAVFLVLTFYTALRVSARNLYDRAYMGWQHCWKAPIAIMVFWAIATLLMGTMGDRTSVTQVQTIGPAMWYFLVMGLWAFLVEVVALTFGPTVVVSMPGLWTLLVGGTVRATPQPVADYIYASGAMVGKWHTWGTPRAGMGTGANAAQPHVNVTPTSAGQPPVAGVGVPAPAAPGAPAAPATPGAPGTAFATAAPITPGAAPVAAPGATSTTMNEQQKKICIIVGAAAGFLVLFGIVYGVLSSAVFSAKSVANSYVAAISSGDYDKANTIADSHVDTNQRALLTSKASSGENTRITNARISQTSNNVDGTVSAQLTYTLEGKEVTGDSIKMVANGSKFLIFKNWTVAEPLVKTISVYAPSSLGSITVNGVTVTPKNAVNNDADETGNYQLKVYPGVYKVGVVKSDYYTAKTVSLSTNSSDSGTLDAQPTDKLTSEIDTAVKSKLDECAASTDAEPQGCPFSYYTSNSSRYRNFKWTIDGYPKVTSVSLSDSSFNTDEGDVTANYEYRYSDGWEPEDDSSTFSVYGNFTIKDNKVSVEFPE